MSDAERAAHSRLQSVDGATLGTVSQTSHVVAQLRLELGCRAHDRRVIVRRVSDCLLPIRARGHRVKECHQHA
jgi:hypothetical protein